MSYKKSFIILLLISVLFGAYGFVQQEKDEVTISEIQLPLSFEKFSLDDIMQCQECAVRTMDLSNYPIKTFFRDVWVLADDSIMVSEPQVDFKGNVLVKTKIGGETRNLLLDFNSRVYFFEDKYYKVSDLNYARLVDVACVF